MQKNQTVNELLAEIKRLRDALQTIADYDKHQGNTLGEGICPYGCDCPHIAQRTLNKEMNEGMDNGSQISTFLWVDWI